MDRPIDGKGISRICYKKSSQIMINNRACAIKSICRFCNIFNGLPKGISKRQGVISRVIPEIQPTVEADRITAREPTKFRLVVTITIEVLGAEPIPAPSGELICMPGGYGFEWLNPGIRNVLRSFGSRLQVFKN